MLQIRNSHFRNDINMLYSKQDFEIVKLNSSSDVTQYAKRSLSSQKSVFLG